MTGIDIREALRAVAEDTTTPTIDRLALERQVRRARRHRLGERATLGVAVAAAVALVTAVTVPFLSGTEDAGSPAVATPTGTGSVDLQTPIYLVVDGRLTAIDPQGQVHDLGQPSEDVIGYTAEFVYALDTDSHVIRFDATKRDEGPAGWRFEQVDAGVEGAVQSAQLSADGRYLGWLDPGERLHTADLKAGTTTEPVDQPRNTYLTDLAQGTGFPLVSQDGDLVLLTPEDDIAIPTAADGYGFVSTVRRDLVAVVDRDDTTRLYDVSSGMAQLVDSVPGTGLLSPYGDHLASVSYGDADVTTALLWSDGGEPVDLGVPGSPQSVAWADDDTVLVSSAVAGQEALYGCEVADPTACALLLEADGPVRLAR